MVQVVDNKNRHYNVAHTIIKETEDIGWGYRHQQCAILWCCIAVAYSLRSCMGVTLVVMIERPEDISRNMTSNDDDTGWIWNVLLVSPPYPKLDWNKKIQDTVLASFFWGYMVLQIPSGIFVHRFATRTLITGAMAVNGVISFCLPWAAIYGGWILTAIFRIIQGLSQSCILPGMHAAFGKWIPLGERGRLAAFAYGGASLGTVLGMPIAGLLATTPLGWPGIFRFYGVLSCLTACLMWSLGADSPAKHKNISAKEKKYIEESLGQSGHEYKKQLPIPWKKILSCRGLYAIILAHIGYNWVNLTLYTQVPAFMDKVMKVNIKANGFLTALPFFGMWLSNFVYCWLSDMLIVKKYLSVTYTRKLANSFGSVLPSIGLIILAFVKKDIYVVETLLVIICCLSIATNVGHHVNHIDIAPNFAGPMMSVSNFGSNLCGSLAPIAAGFLLTDVNNEFDWRKVFFLSAGISFFANLVFVIFGTGELADWNEPRRKKNVEEDLMLQREGRELEIIRDHRSKK